MCTVSYIAGRNRKYFTSNRDENKNRESAATPQTEIRNGKKITFPKVPVGGGTWFAVSENGTVGILLNGAFQKHTPFYPYRKSRGLILLDLMDAEDGVVFFYNAFLENIEPFTMIYFYSNKLYELRWDGHQKHFLRLDVALNYIWSSVTLYNNDAIDKRGKLFQDFIANDLSVNSRSILDFHCNNYDDYENGFIIKRNNGIQTQCITQAIIRESNIRLLHHDLIRNCQHEQIIEIQHAGIIEKN